MRTTKAAIRSAKRPTIADSLHGAPASGVRPDSDDRRGALLAKSLVAAQFDPLDMNRVGGFTWWLRSVLGLRPRWTGYVTTPPGWRWWHRFIPGRATPAPPPIAFTGPPPWAMPPEDELGVDVRGLEAETPKAPMTATGFSPEDVES